MILDSVATNNAGVGFRGGSGVNFLLEIGQASAARQSNFRFCASIYQQDAARIIKCQPANDSRRTLKGP